MFCPVCRVTKRGLKTSISSIFSQFPCTSTKLVIWFEFLPVCFTAQQYLYFNLTFSKMTTHTATDINTSAYCRWVKEHLGYLTSGWKVNWASSPPGVWGCELLPKVISLSKYETNLMCNGNDMAFSQGSASSCTASVAGTCCDERLNGGQKNVKTTILDAVLCSLPL